MAFPLEKNKAQNEKHKNKGGEGERKERMNEKSDHHAR